MVGYRASNIYVKQRRNIKIFNGHQWYNYDNYITYGFRVVFNTRNRYAKYGSTTILKDSQYIGIDIVTDIEELGEEEVYDIEVGGSHNFVAEGIVVHNSGPDKHTIGSPGAAPSAVTVGAWSITDQAISWFSSRGPQGAWYKGKEDELQKALNVYGEDAIKPDTCAPGGGRKNKEDKPDEVLYSAVTGWFDGFYDGIPDGFEGMHGTSQATPHVAGLITLLVEAGKVNSSADVKQVLKEKGHTKDEEEGYGLIKLSMFT
jgi:subtilisin family serine protease